MTLDAWDALLVGYTRNDMVEKAVETLYAMVERRWLPSRDSLQIVQQGLEDSGYVPPLSFFNLFNYVFPSIRRDLEETSSIDKDSLPRHCLYNYFLCFHFTLNAIALSSASFYQHLPPSEGSRWQFSLLSSDLVPWPDRFQRTTTKRFRDGKKRARSKGYDSSFYGGRGNPPLPSSQGIPHLPLVSVK